jgi:hypothetical protein
MKNDNWVLFCMIACLFLLVVICFQRIGDLSNRLGMVITVQQSQQDRIKNLLERTK